LLGSSLAANVLADCCGGRTVVATLIIRDVEDSLVAWLTEQAAAHGRSMEEEAHCILCERLASATGAPKAKLGDAIRALFEPLGGLDLPEIKRGPMRDPPDFSGPEWDVPK